jgi:hypothetical protein
VSDAEEAMLRYAKSALDAPHLESAVEVVWYASPDEVQLRAHCRRRRLDRQPAPHTGPASALHRLITLGYLVYRAPWLTITAAGEVALAQALGRDDGQPGA